MDNKTPYHWKLKDKWLYALSLIPFVAMLILGLVIMTPICFYMSTVWILIYIVVNIFQAGCCVGCPYRGKYCPAFCGVFLGNMISSYIYSDYDFDEKFFKRNALWGEISLSIFILYPVYWLFISSWYLPLIYIGLFLLHVVLFLPSQCSKCSYNEVCPGGRFLSKVRSVFYK